MVNYPKYFSKKLSVVVYKEGANAIIIILGIYFFFNITLGVIMGMDTMECFLHALRLQWVEIQNKFYKADGWKFMPLTIIAPIQAKVDAIRAE
jgi:V-type H+-transporting ATPase subunit a